MFWIKLMCLLLNQKNKYCQIWQFAAILNVKFYDFSAGAQN